LPGLTAQSIEIKASQKNDGCRVIEREYALRAFAQAVVIPGRCEASNPESRGFPDVQLHI
jgi:hypothetical protein